MSSSKEVFCSVLRRTGYIQHDVDVVNATPIKLPPYKVSRKHVGVVQKELDYMLSFVLIKACTNPWSSFVALKPKRDGSTRFCTRTDAYPMLRLEDCIDRIGTSKFISDLDLKQGFWQVPLTERAREISFVVNGQTCVCEVMQYSMRTYPPRFGGSWTEWHRSCKTAWSTSTIWLCSLIPLRITLYNWRSCYGDFQKFVSWSIWNSASSYVQKYRT